MSEIKVLTLKSYGTPLVLLKQEGEDTWVIQATHGRVILSGRELRDLGFCINAMRGDRDAKESTKAGGSGV
jgi:hypothetical protein